MLSHQLQLHDKTTPIDIAQITVAAAQAKKLEAEADNLNQDTKAKDTEQRIFKHHMKHSSYPNTDNFRKNKRIGFPFHIFE